MMHHHDQSKLLSNESVYFGDTRYQIDDGMMEEFMNTSEPLNDLNFDKNSIVLTSSSSNMIPIMNEDYFNPYQFNHMSNIITSNNFNNINNQYTFHTLQSTPSHQTYTNHQFLPNNSNQNTSYISIGQSMPSSQCSTSQNNSNLTSQNTNSSNSSNSLLLNTQQSYGSKIINRTPSFNSSVGSSASSPSSSNSTTSSHANQSLINGNSTASNAALGSGEFIDNDLSSSPAPNANDPAEQARLKQLRGIKLTPEEVQLLVKDRQRKDNHNMIERRRRFNINDRIKELGQLLPKNGEFDTKQNKGSILKASVDYINQIKNENEEAKKLQETNKYLFSLNKKLYNRIKELENICRANGLIPNNTNGINDNYLSFNGKSEISDQNQSNHLHHQQQQQHQHQQNQIQQVNQTNLNDNNMILNQNNTIQILNRENTPSTISISSNNNNYSNIDCILATICNKNDSIKANDPVISNLTSVNEDSLMFQSTVTAPVPTSTQSNSFVDSSDLLTTSIHQNTVEQAPKRGRYAKKRTANEKDELKIAKKQNNESSKSSKVPKEEPISPKTNLNQVGLDQKLLITPNNDPIDDSNFKISSSPTDKPANLENIQISNINKDISSNETVLSSPSISTSTSPLVKLMTSQARDPMLASSSVSSPLQSTSPTSSTSPCTTTNNNNNLSFFPNNQPLLNPASPVQCTITSSSTNNICQSIPCLVNSNNNCFD